MVETNAADRWSTPPRLHRLWAAVLLPPLAWSLHLGVGYALATMACTPAATPILYGLSLAAIGMCLAGGWLANRLRHDARPGDEAGRDSASRARFMALGALLLSALFAAAVVAQTIPILFLEPCR